MKKPSLAALKRKLWSIFSEYIRRRDVDEYGYVRCFSCGKTQHWKEANAGHFYPKSLGLQVYFVEKNVHPQCVQCNLTEQGNQHKYAISLMEKYGAGVIEELEAIKNKDLKLSRAEYQEMISTYKEKLKGLGAR